jgi:hypothetical protein
MGNSWGNMDTTWEQDGKTWENMGKNMETSLKHDSNDGNIGCSIE